MSTATQSGTNSHLLTEDVIALKDVASELPTRPCISTVWRWAQRGVGGVKLETYRIGGRNRVTSKQALHRFLEAIQAN